MISLIFRLAVAAVVVFFIYHVLVVVERWLSRIAWFIR